MVKKESAKKSTLKFQIKKDSTIEKDDNQLCGGKVIEGELEVSCYLILLIFKRLLLTTKKICILLLLRLLFTGLL